MSINKILSKALSTQSEEEAITALLLARKKYGGGQITAYEDAEHWKEIAKQLQDAAKQERYFRKKYFSNLTVTKMSLNIEEAKTRRLEKEVSDLKSEVSDLKSKANTMMITNVGLFALTICLILLLAL